jgi:hypothetical protein
MLAVHPAAMNVVEAIPCRVLEMTALVTMESAIGT